MSSRNLESLWSTSCDVSTGRPATAYSYPLQATKELALADARIEQLIERAEARAYAYEGAAPDRINGGTWLTSRQSTDSDLEIDFDELRQRSRFLARNDSIGGMVDQRKDLVVGTGFTYLPIIEEYKGLITADQAEQYNDELSEVMESVAYRIGITGVDSLWDLTRLIEGHHAFDGESVTILSDLAPDDDKPIPFVVEVVDPMRMDTPPEKAGDPNCRMGVQYSDSGRILGYWIQKKHPGDTKDYDLTFEFYERSRVLHVFEKFFARQSRGLPWLVRNLNRLVDRKDLDQAGIVLAQVRSCLMGFLEETTAGGMDPTGAVKAWANDPKVLEEFAKSFVPGTITKLPAGLKLTYSQPPTGSDITDSLNMTNDRRIAGGMNESYEMVARDWRGHSFAGGRIVLSGVKTTTEVRQESLSQKWLIPIAHRIQDEAVILSLTSIPARLYRSRPLPFRRHAWLPPVWPFSINPGEEIKAMLAAVDGNLMAKAVAIARFTGGSWKRISQARSRERQDERDLNIVPPTNSMGDEPVKQDASGSDNQDNGSGGK